MGSLAAASASPFAPVCYPRARRDESVVDDYHGVLVADPYRWLEDPESEETKEFVTKQAALTDAVLAQCDERFRLHNQITSMYDHPRFYPPFKRGGKYFYFQNTGLQAHNILHVQNGLDAEAEVLLDPSMLSEDGTVALSRYAVSEDGKYLAYGLSSCGSDWVTIKVMRVEDKKVEPDILSWVKFSQISWTHDGKGFFYSRYPALMDTGLNAGTQTKCYLNHEVYYHFLGTDQSNDILCWRDHEHPNYIYSTDVTEDGKYVLLEIEEGSASANKLYYCDLSKLPIGVEGFKGSTQLLPFVKLVDSFEAQYVLVSIDVDTKFTFLTNKGAPKYKLVRVDLKEPETWNDVLPEDSKDVLESARAINGSQVLVCYISDVKYILQVRDLKTGQLLHNLPIDIGTVTWITGRRRDSEAFIGFTSFLTPGIVYRCNLAAQVPEMTIFREITVPGFDRGGFEVKQVFVSSKDGTKIPMFVVSRNNILLDGSHPALLYGYGGFNVSLTPSFNVSRTVLMRNLGFVFCLANIRGGGEYGEEWHRAGTCSNKQNCFDDFIASAEFLISAGYTSSERLCIEGGSNGGLLVAACVNQRPELFGCVLAHVGVMDMLRFHRFTIGHVWASEFGCSDNEEDFQWIIRYSPLHNVRRPWEKHADHRSCQYPPTMLLTADHDDRVVPLHSLKFLATLQYTLCTSVEEIKQTNPIIARIDRKAGHGAGRSTQKQIDEASDRYGFVAKMFGASWIE